MHNITGEDSMDEVPVPISANCIYEDGSIVPSLWSVQWDKNKKLIHCVDKDSALKKNREDALK